MGKNERQTKTHTPFPSHPLSDDAARENYEKYGHPDGPQGMRMNIALPEWVFAKDARAAPWLLGVLIVGGILTPLLIAVVFLWRSSNAVGLADVSGETIDIFLRSKWCVKEAHTVRAIQDTLVMAFEFITRPCPRGQANAMVALQRDVSRLLRPDLKGKEVWWKRRASILKSEFIFIAHTHRHSLPAELSDDAAFHLAKAPVLLTKIVEIARIPRVYGWPYGWLAPTLGAIEYAQCLAAAIPPAVRRPLPGTKGFYDAALAALPHLDADGLKRLARRKLRNVADVASLPPSDRAAALADAGLDASQAADVDAALAALPRLTVVGATAAVDGADDDAVRPGDVVTVSARVLLTRAAHGGPGAAPPAGKVAAFAPHARRRVTERWWVIVGDAATNTCFAVSPIDLREAEKAAFHPNVRAALAQADGDEGSTVALAAAAGGATVSITFDAPGPGKYDLTLHLLCDAWVGADAVAPVTLLVSEVTRAEREGRAAPTVRAVAAAADDDAAEGDDDADAAPAAADDSDASDSDDREWDLEESGTEASSDDEAVVAARALDRARAAARTAAAPAAVARPAVGSSADSEIEAAADQ